MTLDTQDQFLADIKTQVYQFVYRSSESPINALFTFLQESSGNGSLNWHTTQNKELLSSVFIRLAAAINNYTLPDGDFRSYILTHAVEIIYDVYQRELFKQYLRQGYNVAPESVVGSIADSYSTQPPQNTNFPGTANTSNKFVPEIAKTRLVSSNLYE